MQESPRVRLNPPVEDHHVPRISSVQTLKSTYLSHESSSDSPEAELMSSELQALAQVHLDSLAKPCQFNVLLAGDAGLGKSAFIECLLKLKFNSGYVPNILKEGRTSEGPVRPPTHEICHNKASKFEGGLNVNLDLIDTPGYGTWGRFDEWLRTIGEFIKGENMQYLCAKEKKSKIDDTRIHLCLYFLEGPHIKQTDLKALHYLQSQVNIIPILAKADAFTPMEIVQVKLEIIQQCAEAGLRLFDCAKYMREEIRLIAESPLGPCPPFAVISSVECLETTPGKVIYGRVYPWGVCDVNNPCHSDFNLLYHVLIGYLMQPAIEETKLLVRQLAKQRPPTPVHSCSESNLVKIGCFLGIVALGTLVTYRFNR
jgi:septin family protein